MPGGRKEVVEDREILEIFAQSEDPVLFTSEIAEEIGFSNEGTRPRLQQLEEKGLVASKTGGGQVPAWWLTKKGEKELSL